MEVGAILLHLRLKTWVMTLPAPKIKWVPYFVFVLLLLSKKLTMKWILKQTFFFTKFSGAIIKVGPQDLFLDPSLREVVSSLFR